MSHFIPMARSRGQPARSPYVRGGKGEEKFFEVPSTVGGLAFAPKGLRLAIAHYNGVTLWFPNMAANAEVLEWAGSHLGVVFSPDNKFLVTAMHEPALHGWRLADTRHMRMTGYPGRVRSLSWSAGGKGLATSGADTVIIWPFASKDGPMGKEPAMLAPLQARVSAVACHPKQDILAAGYSDGTVLMVRLNDGAEILVRKNGGAQVSALAWNAKGHAAGLCRGRWRRGVAGAVIGPSLLSPREGSHARAAGNYVWQWPLMSRTISGEPNACGRQPTRLQDEHAASRRHGGGRARCHRPVGGQAQRQQSASPDGAGDAAAAIDAGRGEQAVSSFRADDDRRAADRGSP